MTGRHQPRPVPALQSHPHRRSSPGEAPRSNPGPSPASGASMTHPTNQPKFSVLIVEDDEVQANTLATYFRVSTDYHVAVAHDGDAAIAIARKTPPDVVICDIGLPTTDGLTVVQELTRFLPKKPL